MLVLHRRTVFSSVVVMKELSEEIASELIWERDNLLAIGCPHNTLNPIFVSVNVVVQQRSSAISTPTGPECD